MQRTHLQKQMRKTGSNITLRFLPQLPAVSRNFNEICLKPHNCSLIGREIYISQEYLQSPQDTLIYTTSKKQELKISYKCRPTSDIFLQHHSYLKLKFNTQHSSFIKKRNRMFCKESLPFLCFQPFNIMCMQKNLHTRQSIQPSNSLL